MRWVSLRSIQWMILSGREHPKGTCAIIFKIDGMIEYTLPNKPRSPRQKYQLTDKGKTELANLKSEDAV